ncbi:MAG: aminotransferase class I/II-fold pyridoxal phosphate-dependent enzyme [Planctomycetota bacterium]|nr:aminotransferase class I/II-fold pyridoxal phosphate-dependent enzyme [Planctomycetota bacterium]
MPSPTRSAIRPAARTAPFTESVIREMSRVATAEGAVNLAQGFPDFAAPAAMKAAAKRAIDADINQYAVTWGAPDLRQAIATRTSAYNRVPTDADAHVTVCCGATEAMVSTMMAVVDPGDEVVVFEPFYENYGPDCTLCGATPRFVRLSGPDWTFDEAELRAAFGPRTKAIIVNTPHNPTGKVFTREELELIAALCCEHDALAITDEIYEYILYDGAEHLSIASLEGMAERTVTISGLSKTWSATGWRIGWCLAPEHLTGAIRKVHDFLTVGAPAPLQAAAAEALAFDDSYFDELRAGYTERRDVLVAALADCGFDVVPPLGAYYVMAGIGAHAKAGEDDTAFALRLARAGGVATVPGSSFFSDPRDGHGIVRFCFAKQLSTLERAAVILRERLA